MKRVLVVLFSAALLLTFGLVLQINAEATVDSYFLGCHSATASGTTTAPYIIIEVYNPYLSEDLYYAAQATGGSFNFGVSFPQQAPGTDLEYWVWGSPTPALNDWDREDYFYFTGSCQEETGDNAPGIPNDFVLMTITCDTPVYDTPAGSPVGETLITTGQTWFVNPTPVEGDDGKQWTEIFAGGFINGFIPTSCVG